MDSDLKLLCDGSRSFQMLHMFNKSVGKLQGLLCKGEYALLKHLLIFESDFIQVRCPTPSSSLPFILFYPQQFIEDPLHAECTESLQ